MVALISQAKLPEPSRRLLEILQKSGLPGDETDHVWMAGRLCHFAENMGEPHTREYLEDLLVTGFLLAHGMNPAGLNQLHGREFPDEVLRAVPPLLKIGCPSSSWRLVEKGVLSYEGPVWGGEGRWVIRGQLLKPMMDEWHELGEQMVMQHVARGLVPLVYDSQVPTQIKLNGVDRKTGRKWLSDLRCCLQYMGGSRLPHLMLNA